jgi:hypothetical protein
MPLLPAMTADLIATASQYLCNGIYIITESSLTILKMTILICMAAIAPDRMTSILASVPKSVVLLQKDGALLQKRWCSCHTWY